MKRPLHLSWTIVVIVMHCEVQLWISLASAFSLPRLQRASIPWLLAHSQDQPRIQDDAPLSTFSSTDRPSWVPRLAYVVVAQFRKHLHPSSNILETPLSKQPQAGVTTTMITPITISQETYSLTNNSFPLQTAAAIVKFTHQIPQTLPTINDPPAPETIPPVFEEQQQLVVRDRFFPIKNQSDNLMWNLTQDLGTTNNDDKIPLEESILMENQTISFTPLPFFTQQGSTNVDTTTLTMSSSLSKVSIPTKDDTSLKDDDTSNLFLDIQNSTLSQRDESSSSVATVDPIATVEPITLALETTTPTTTMTTTTTATLDDDDDTMDVVLGIPNSFLSQQLPVEESSSGFATVEPITTSPASDPETTLTTTTPSTTTTTTISEESNDSSSSLLPPLLQRQSAAQIAHSFYAKKFRPAWFATNPHLQTIAAVKARQESMYFPSTLQQQPVPPSSTTSTSTTTTATTTTTTATQTQQSLTLNQFQWDYRQRVEVPGDGDFFDVDWKFASSPTTTGSVDATTNINIHTTNTTTTPVVLICHGLQSNTDSPLVKDMAIAFHQVGMDVAAINFRGCSGEPNRTPMGYHLSFTKDLEYLVQQISTTQPHRTIYLSGFSLGANVVTKFLADCASRAFQEYNIGGAAVNAVPFDLTKAQAINQPGFSGTVYGKVLLKSLQERVLQSMEQQKIQYNFTKEQLMNCQNCKEFDDLVVCSVYTEFENANDYHVKSSTGQILDKIMVPHYILQSLDDPFFQGNVNPENNPQLPCRIEYTEHGGHCGYVFHTEEYDRADSSFMPTELARFLQHVHQVRLGQKSTKVAWRQPVPLPALSRTYQQKYRRKQAAIAAHSFQARDFSPIEWATNEHVQTIMGTLFRKETMYVKKDGAMTSLFVSLVAKENTPFQWDQRQRMTTPLEDDFFDVDWKYTRTHANSGTHDSPSSDNIPVVLICHGLQSDSSSPLVQDMAQAFNDIGMDAACINFRGCSGEINKTPVGYHLGFTEDLKQMIEYIHTKSPRRRIYLSGFSLGANVVTSCLAELGERAYQYNICGAAVNAVPFDMTRAHVNLNQNGLTKSLYGTRLLASMVERIESSYDRIPFPFPIEEVRKCRTIMDVENLVIAPIFGFQDAYDYYEQASSGPKVDRIAVPQLVIQAKDDPFFVGQKVPDHDPSRPLRIHWTEHGGHCGYVFHVQKENDDDDDDVKAPSKTSWMPTELARFLAHLEESFSLQVDRLED